MELERLIEKCIQNDRDSQRTLYYKYKDSLYTLAYRLTGDFETSNDLLQECFIDVFKNLKQLKEKKFFYSWVKKILIRKTYKYLEKQVTTEDILENQQVSIISGGHFDVEYIEQAIHALSKKARSVFVMYEIEGFSHKEISETMGISVGTSKSQLNYAKTKLKELLKAYVL